MDDSKAIMKALGFKLTFGKFFGHTLEQVPNSYLYWLSENSRSDYVCQQADIVRRWRDKYGIIVED